MTITQIECFIEAARMKSLSKAAAKLFISQPTISRQIRALEKDLGFPLFERKNIGVRLTPMGEILFSEWKRMLQIHRSAVDKAKDLYYRKQKNIRIGIHDFVEPRERIANALIRYNQKYPELEVEYEILQMSELLSGMEEGKLHCVIAYASEIEGRYGFKTLYLDEISMRAGIVCSRNHPLSKKTQPDLADIQGETVGIFSENASSDHGKRIKKLLEDHGGHGAGSDVLSPEIRGGHI